MQSSAGSPESGSKLRRPCVVSVQQSDLRAILAAVQEDSIGYQRQCFWAFHRAQLCHNGAVTVRAQYWKVQHRQEGY